MTTQFITDLHEMSHSAFVSAYLAPVSLTAFLQMRAQSADAYVALASGAVSHTDTVRNVVVGASALANVSGGTDNTAIGQNALNANVTGNANVAIGQGVLALLDASNSNVGVGEDALAALVSGGDNVAIGEESLKLLASGNFNVALGDASGNNVTSATGCMFLGRNTTASFGVATSEVVIGNDAVGHGDYTFTYGTSAYTHHFPGKIVNAKPPILPSSTVAGVAAAFPPATYPGGLVYLTNGASNKKIAISDGSVWRYPDGVAV